MSSYDSGSWAFDEDPGPLVRPFAVTRGRAGRDIHKLDMLTLVVAVRSDADLIDRDREYAEIVRLCQGRPQSIVELAAHLNLMLAAVKVLVSDLINSGHLISKSPALPVTGPDPDFLQAVIDGIRRL
jgi:hypothetical protein